MRTTDEVVLKFIGSEGQPTEAVAERFPGFDVMRLVRARLVDLVLHEPAETVAHVLDPGLGQMWFVLTRRGADAVGIASKDR